MRNIRLTVFALPLLLLSAGSVSRALPSDGRLSFIGQIPGLSHMASETTGKKDEVVYSVTGDPKAIVSKVRQGLVERGWKIKETGEVAAGGVTSGDTLEATREGQRVEIMLSDVMGVKTLAVDLFAGSGAAASLGSSSVSAGGGTVRTGGAIVVNDNSVKTTYDCGGCVLTMNGNKGDVTLDGSATAITLNGDDNKVSVKGSITAVTFNGDGNTVLWSSDKGPAIVDNGEKNGARRATP